MRRSTHLEDIPGLLIATPPNDAPIPHMVGVVGPEDRHQCVPVMGVRDLPPVVAFSSSVREGLIGDLGVLVQKHLDLADADAQVILIELIWNVPSNGSELSPFLHDS